MTIRLAALVGAALALCFPGGAEPLEPPGGIVRVTSETIRQFTKAGDKTTVILLYNRGITQAAIGNGVMSCDFVGRGGPLGSSTSLCEATYSLPRGRISVSGIVKTRSYYILAVIGGTGIYSNVRGELVGNTLSLGPRVERLLFGLEA